MTNRKTTRRVLVLSLLSLLVCCSMLVGTTFAWFTDSVTSGNNKIVAGNLDVELYHSNKTVTDEKVTNTTLLFDDIKLWEPGVVAWENLTVSNEGTLALKYKLSVNFDNATETPAGKTLADVLKVAFVKDGVDGTLTREEMVAGITGWGEMKSFVQEGKLLAGETTPTTDTYGIVIWWEPGANDNDFNMNNGNQALELSIDLGVNLFATQVEAELDSFGNDYDKPAPFSVWNGVVPAQMPASLVVDGDAQTVHVQDADAFVYLSTLSEKWAELYTDGNGRTYTNYANGAGANYYYSGQWKVELEADIDLNDHRIEPVAIMFGEGTGSTVFDGNGHTIKNINTTTGLFAGYTRAQFSNLTLDTVKATNGALSSSVSSSVYNVTVKNATISGTEYVGGLVGRAFGNIENCKVVDSSVTASGKEAGGLVGYIETNSNATSVTNNAVFNVTVNAGNRAAGLIAQVNVNVKVYGNTIDTVTVGAVDTATYQPDAVVSNALDAANVYDNTVTNVTVN